MLLITVLCVYSCDRELQLENDDVTAVTSQNDKLKLLEANNTPSFSTVKIVDNGEINVINLHDDLSVDTFNRLKDMLENNFTSIYTHDNGLLVLSKESISDEDALDMTLGKEKTDLSGKTSSSVGWLVRLYQHKNQGGMSQSWSGTKNFNTGTGVSSGVFRTVSSAMNAKTSSVLLRLRNKGRRTFNRITLSLFEHNPPQSSGNGNFDIYRKDLRPGNLDVRVVNNLKDHGFNDYTSSWQFFF